MGIMAGAAVIGAGVSAYGVYTQNEARSDATAAAQQQAAVSGQQAALSAEFAGKEADINKQASEFSYAAAASSGDINKSIIQGQLSIEEQRRQYMEFTSRAQQLEIVRRQQAARSLGLTSATAQGAQFGSGLQGGYGQISGRSGVNLLQEQQNLEIGQNIFAANRSISNQKMALFDLQTTYARQQADVQTSLSDLKAAYAQQGAALTTAYSAAGSNLATAQGAMSFGGSMTGLGANIFQVGQVASRAYGGGTGFGAGANQPISLAPPTQPPPYQIAGVSPGTGYY